MNISACAGDAVPYKNKEDAQRNAVKRRKRIYSTPEGTEKQRAAVRNSMKRTGYLSRPDVKAKRLALMKTPRQKENQKKLKLSKRYGISVETLDLMYVAQQFRCAICAVEEWAVGTLHVDHDHRTNEVRSLLCKRCNIALGYFDDDPHRLEIAASYLRRHGCG